MQTFDVTDPKHLWIDRFAISSKIQDTRLDDGGHIITFRAYTDSDSSWSMVRCQNISFLQTGFDWAEKGDVDPSRRLSTQKTPGIFAELLDDLRSPERNLSTTIILGPDMGEKCATLIDTSFQGCMSYYVLPHKAG